MRSSLISLALLAAAAPGAAALPPAPPDSPCGFVGNGNGQGLLDGGPVFETGTLTCTVKMGVSQHDQAAVHSATASADGLGVTVLHPTFVTYQQPPETNAYLCTDFVDQTGTRYYFDGSTNLWTTNSRADCELTVAL